MAIAGIVLFIAVIIGFVQTWLSFRKNKIYGLILPSTNLIVAILLAMMTSDFFVCFLVFFTVSLPALLWLGIYKLVRLKVMKARLDNINKMTIKEL